MFLFWRHIGSKDDWHEFYCCRRVWKQQDVIKKNDLVIESILLRKNKNQWRNPTPLSCV